MPRRKKTDTNNGAGQLPPDVKTVRKRAADGSVKVYYYRRSSGKPIEGEPGTLLFEKSWVAAGQAMAAETAKGEFKALIDRFRNSHEGKKASAFSIAQREWYLVKIEDRFGYMTLADLQDDRTCQEIYDWRDTMAHTPVKADRGVQILGQVLKWAKARKIIKVNQAEDVPKIVSGFELVKRNRAKLIFTPEMEKEVLEKARPCVANAYLLALYTAAREGDLCNFRWDMIDKDGWLIYTPSKTRNSTGVELHIPTFALPPLKALLDRLPRYPHGYILSTDLRRPMTLSTLKQHWPDDRARTSIKLHWHDIRGTAVTRMLAAGCTQAEVASITGHSLSNSVAGMTEQQALSLAKYGSITRDMALNAYHKWTERGFKDFVDERLVAPNIVPLRRPRRAS